MLPAQVEYKNGCMVKCMHSCVHAFFDRSSALTMTVVMLPAQVEYKNGCMVKCMHSYVHAFFYRSSALTMMVGMLPAQVEYWNGCMVECMRSCVHAFLHSLTARLHWPWQWWCCLHRWNIEMAVWLNACVHAFMCSYFLWPLVCTDHDGGDAACTGGILKWLYGWMRARFLHLLICTCFPAKKATDVCLYTDLFVRKTAVYTMPKLLYGWMHAFMRSCVLWPLVRQWLWL